MSERTLRSKRVVHNGTTAPAAIHIADGRIVRVAPHDEVTGQLTDYGDAVISPGIIDTHVHINEPGRTEWEGFETATRAALAGGITTLVDMPLNSIPSTNNVAALEAKRAAAREQLWVDVAFWGGFVPGNEHHLAPLIAAGARGFKCFLTPSGTPDFEYVTEAGLRRGLSHLNGAVLQAHCELPDRLVPSPEGDPNVYETYLRSRPRAAENDAIALMISLAREFNARIHIVHLSSSDALPLLRAAKQEGLRITVETCPHYLFFNAEDIPAGSVAHKCAPPIREHENRDLLWEGLRDGTIDLVATDHSPAPPELKQGSFLEAWGGISSLQLSLPIVWTEARSRGFAPHHLAEWMSTAPARLAGLENRKGAIAPGLDADFVVWYPELPTLVESSRLHHRHKMSPYDGLLLDGFVGSVWLRGEAGMRRKRGELL